MKAPSLTYVRPDSLHSALEHLSDGEGRVLAGGQSLVPALNMRLDRPARLVDINRIKELRGIEDRGTHIQVNALVRHAEVESSPLVARSVPLVAMAMRYVAHPAIRNRGTTCGSLAHADPAAEIPACAVTLGATLILRSSRGDRHVAAREFFRGLYETARQDDELLESVLFPAAEPGDFFAFEEIAMRHGDFPSVGVAIRGRLQDDVIAALNLTIFASEPGPLMCSQAEQIAVGRRLDDDLIREIASVACREMRPLSNLQGRPETKRHQARVLCERALRSVIRREPGKVRHAA